MKKLFSSITVLLCIVFVRYAEAQVPGYSMSNAINAGTYHAVGNFSDVQNNATGGFTNNYGNPANDVWYTFTINSMATSVDISLCGSSFDTYLHVLNSSGTELYSNDDADYCGRDDYQSYIPITNLPAGTYYIDAEGYSANQGTLNFSLNVSIPTPLMIAYPTGNNAFIAGTTTIPLNPTISNGTVASMNQTITFAGNGSASSGDGTGYSASFDQPLGMAMDAQGNAYVADGGSSEIRKITPAGVVTTLAGSFTGFADGQGSYASLNHPVGLAVDAFGNVYIADENNHAIRKMTPSGYVSTLAGNGTAGSTDATGASATFNLPCGVAVDAVGNVYVADYNNNKIRKITPDHIVTTFAGTGVAGSSDGPVGTATFNHPFGVAFDASGNLYVTDRLGERIRKITRSGIVSTLAGSSPGYADGTGTAAQFNLPTSLALDAAGNVYVTDETNQRIRKITPAGVVTTVAGNGSIGANDGVGASASFDDPFAITAAPNGFVYIGDLYNYLVRKIITTPFNISPALPSGLSIDQSSGSISGTPTVSAEETPYIVNAYNATNGQSVQTTVDITTVDESANNSVSNFISTWIPSLPVTTVAALKSHENDNTAVNISTTFLDGLGLKAQTVAKNQTVNNTDLVQPYEYDNMGREVKSYLPYAYSSSTPGAYRANASALEQPVFYNSGSTTNPQSSHAYAQISADNSPLDRILEQGSVGDNWQLTNSGVSNSGHTAKYDYLDNNSTGISDVNNTRLAVLYTVSIDNNGNRSLVANGYYPNSDLFVTTTRGENWVSTDLKAGTSETYTNKEGQVVLKRIFVNNSSGSITILSTYFVYDDLGNLAYVLPPGSSPDDLTPSGTVAISSTLLNTMCYQYNYDSKRRLIGTRTPGKDWEYFVYNGLNQQVAMQDGVQRSRNEWSIKKYDAVGRLIISGTWNNNNTSISQAALQAILDSQTTFWESRVATGNGYTSLAWPQSLFIYYGIHFYDDYNVPGLPVGFAYQTYSGNANGYSNQTQGFETVLETWSLSNPTVPLWTVHYVDTKGRTIQIHSTNQLSGSDIYNYEYNFNDQVTKTVRQHSSSVASLNITNRYNYDHNGRLIQHYEQIGSDPEVLLAQLAYNDLGQLVNKKLHQKSGSNSFIQSIDYRYNIRGWLTSINDPSLVANSATNPDNLSTTDADKFGINYQYDQAALPQYNGTIGSTQWSTASPQGSPAAPLLKYDFRYDKIGRVTESVSSTGTTKDANFSEYSSYDGMGNLKTMGRWAKLAAGRTQIDSLSYSYNGNQVNAINDLSGNNTYGFNENVNGSVIQQANEYAFDANGNLTQDLNKGITSITYNNFNLPASITWGNGNTLVYEYDGTGNKLTSTYTAGGNAITTSYINGIQYLQGQINLVQTGEGLAIKNYSTGSYIYNYELKDILGSTRVVIQPSGPSETTATIVQINNYYGYGLTYGSDDPNLMVNYVNGSQDNFLFNGQEQQYGTADYDFGARQYDPATGRWNTPDPGDQLVGQSPYLAMGNNPILYTDPDGRWFGLDDLFAAAIGGIINLATNAIEGHIHSIGAGLSYFAVGALSGEATLYGGPMAGAAVMGFGNNLTSQVATYGWSHINFGQLAESTAIGTATAYAGGVLGNVLAPYASTLTSQIASPVLKEALSQSLNNAVSGFALGTATSLISGRSLGQSVDDGLSGAAFGFGTGLVSGSISGYQEAKEQHLGLWSGRSTDPPLTAVNPSVIIDPDVRTEPADLPEQLMMQDAQAGGGEQIMAGKIKDARYQSPWIKMQTTHELPDGMGTISIHYWLNTATGKMEGFKFKNLPLPQKFR